MLTYASFILSDPVAMDDGARRPIIVSSKARGIAAFL